MTRLIYLDNNATTALHPEVLEEMLPFFRDNSATLPVSTGRDAG